MSPVTINNKNFENAKLLSEAETIKQERDTAEKFTSSSLCSCSCSCEENKTELSHDNLLCIEHASKCSCPCQHRD